MSVLCPFAIIWIVRLKSIEARCVAIPIARASDGIKWPAHTGKVYLMAYTVYNVQIMRIILLFLCSSVRVLRCSASIIMLCIGCMACVVSLFPGIVHCFNDFSFLCFFLCFFFVDSIYICMNFTFKNQFCMCLLHAREIRLPNLGIGKILLAYWMLKKSRMLSVQYLRIFCQLPRSTVVLLIASASGSVYRPIIQQIPIYFAHRWLLLSLANSNVIRFMLVFSLV